MSLVLDAMSWLCLVLGAAFSVTSGIGMLRLPDFYSRLHAAGMSDTMGAGLILLGLMLQAGLSLVTVKLVTVLVFLWLTSPASTQALGKAAYWGGVEVYGEPEGGRGAIPH